MEIIQNYIWTQEGGKIRNLTLIFRYRGLSIRLATDPYTVQDCETRETIPCVVHLWITGWVEVSRDFPVQLPPSPTDGRKLTPMEAWGGVMESVGVVVDRILGFSPTKPKDHIEGFDPDEVSS